MDELHEFAADLGCRRVSFQGDHYDIDVTTRTVAIERGAHACDSRELVRRIRDAGLRARPSTFEKWGLAHRGDAWTETTVAELAAIDQPTVHSLLKQFSSHPDVVNAASRCSGWFVLHRENAAALVVHGSTAGVVGMDGLLPVGDDHGRGLFVRVGHEDDRPTWTVEMIWPTPQSHQ